MRQLFTNNAKALLAANIVATDVSCAVQTGQGSMFPNPVVGKEYFRVTLENLLDREVIYVLERSTDSFVTILRGQEGTTAANFYTGDRVELRNTAGAMADADRGRGISAGFDGSGSLLDVTGGTIKQMTPPMHYSGTLRLAAITADQSGSCTIKVRKCARGVYPASLADITGGGNLVLSTATQMLDDVLSGWTKDFSEGDVFELELFSVSGLKKIAILLGT